ncbi:MAG: D-alanyl-D-alanine carboxypeptidase/D-alanyl-D-alanine-endopeptidase [Geobacteraceae bacterium]
MKLVRFSFLAHAALLIILAGCASQKVSYTCPVPVPVPVPSAVPACSSPTLLLKKKLDGMIARELLPYSVASIKVVSLKSGVTLYETNPSLLMPAASVQKLLIAATALASLGPDHSIETSLSLDTTTNTLYLRGCGDPLLKTADLKQMVGGLAGQLSPGRHYALVGDAGCFDDTYWGSGWMWDDEPDPDAMYLSALSVNSNTIRIRVSPGKAATSPLEVATEPATGYVVIENSGKTGKKGGPCSVSITRAAGDRENHIRVTGTLAPKCATVSRRLTVWRPELYTLTLLAEQLKRAGIQTTSLAMGTAPPEALPLAATRHSIGEIVTKMLKKSDNLCAENLLKYLAHTQTGLQGTAVEGVALIKEYLRQNGIATDRLVIADGSGLSRYNLINADTITRLLVAVSKDQAIFPYFVAALPRAGKDGTLAGRMKGTPAEGKLEAKTGTMSGVSALAGYTVSSEGEPLAFTMIMENFSGSAQRIRRLQDRIAVLLSTFPVLPPVN